MGGSDPERERSPFEEAVAADATAASGRSIAIYVNWPCPRFPLPSYYSTSAATAAAAVPRSVLDDLSIFILCVLTCAPLFSSNLAPLPIYRVRNSWSLRLFVGCNRLA